VAGLVAGLALSASPSAAQTLSILDGGYDPKVAGFYVESPATMVD
jgi:hypothetical protein